MKSLELRNVIGAAALALCASAVLAGPVIIDGTDANDHGSASGGVNLSGWLYMQRALENLAGAVAPSVSKTVTVIGTAPGAGQAANAIGSAFGLSSLVGAGWSINYVNGAAAITTALGSLSTATTGLLYMTTCGNSGGDMDATEMAAVNAAAANINNFVGGAGNASLGGGLFSMAQSCTGAYGWLTTLISGIVATDIGGGGTGTNISLTAAGQAAFPALTNADLAGADPWHGYFSGDLGGLSVLGVAAFSGASRNVIIGGGAGTVIGCGLPGQPVCPPNGVPEPNGLALVALAGLAMALTRRRKMAQR